MFDIGGWEFLVIIVIGIIVIGPKDLPATIRTVAGWVRKARELAREFQSGLSDLAQETEMAKTGEEIRAEMGIDDLMGNENSIRKDLEDAIDPDSEMRAAFKDTGSIADDDALRDYHTDEDDDIDDPELLEAEAMDYKAPEPRDVAEDTPEPTRDGSDKETLDAAKKA